MRRRWSANGSSAIRRTSAPGCRPTRGSTASMPVARTTSRIPTRAVRPHNETAIERDGYLTDLLSRHAVDFIERQTASQPFLLSLHYSAPHWPWLTRDDAEESARTRHKGEH